MDNRRSSKEYEIMTTGKIDWLDSGYFYRDKEGWKYKKETPLYLIRQFENFMKVQSKFYDINKPDF